MKRGLIEVLLLFIVRIESQFSQIYDDSPHMKFDACFQQDLEFGYSYGIYPNGEENQYSFTIKKLLEAGTNIVIVVDSEASVELDSLVSRYIGVSKSDKTFTLNLNHKIYHLKVSVKGEVNGKVPYLKSLLINEVEQCRTRVVGYLNKIVENLRLANQVKASMKEEDCGRRKLNFTELILNGETSRPGEWPWHAALYSREGSSNAYICGGTLISKFFVLTAAHCVTNNKATVAPDVLKVVLGKYHLVGGDTTTQERQVILVIAHEEFRSPKHTDNDIALLKLRNEVLYTDYIQPACLWNSNIQTQTDQVIGTVVGWGISDLEFNSLASELKEATMPMISDLTCIKRDPGFYGPVLSNNKKFCAGWNNGTLACSGDSGGGYLVYVPDASGDTGAWYVRGVVSYIKTFAKNCAPNEYVIFTDTSKYNMWIQTKKFTFNCNSSGSR